MDYCSVPDIEGEFKALKFTPSTDVTDTDVGGFITEASAMIDSYVGGRYTVPVSGVSSLSLMSLYCRTLVSDRVRGIIANKQTTNVDANQNVKAPGMSTTDVIKALKDIQSGASVLPDSPLLLSNAGFFANRTSGPKFHKNVRQW